MTWYKQHNIVKEATAMFTSIGTIKVGPMTKSIKTDSSGWVVIKADNDLTRYYIKQFNFANRAKDIQLMFPAWGGHISIVRGEDIKDKNYLSSLNDKKISFSYDPEVKGNGNHFWLKVECPEAENIREKLGLYKKTRFDFHLTIGVKKG